MPSESFVPLSVRYGNRRKKFKWWLSGRREALALKLAPWLGSRRQRDGDLIRIKASRQMIDELLGQEPFPVVLMEIRQLDDGDFDLLLQNAPKSTTYLSETVTDE